MSAQDIIARATQQGVLLYLKNDQLALQARKNSLSAALKAEIKGHRDAIIAHLRQQQAANNGTPGSEKPDNSHLPAHIPKADRNQPLPLSYSQQRLWFINQLQGSSTQYNTQGTLHFRGKFNVSAFENALVALLERHEVLRTQFKPQTNAPDSDTGSAANMSENSATQHILSSLSLPLTEHDFTLQPVEKQRKALQKTMQNDISQVFDLQHGLPIRVSLIKLGEPQDHQGHNSRHVVVFTLHHIASDAWSVTLFKRELQALYQAFASGQPNPLEPLKIQYADFALWQRQWLNSDNLNQQKTFWLDYLKGIPLKHSLPLDNPRPAKQSHDGLLLQQPINRELTAKIRAVCEQEGVTLFMLLQTLFALVLGRYSFTQAQNKSQSQQETDIVMGTAVAGRLHQDVEPLIGLFLNMLVLRTNVSPGQTLHGLLQHNRDAILQAYQHQSMPFEKLVEELAPERDLSHNALIQILFGVQNNEQDLPASSANSSTPNSSSQSEKSSSDDRIPLSTRFDLKLDVYEIGDELLCGWLYNTSLFADSSITRLSQSFEVLVNHACEQLLGSSKGNIDIAHLQVLANSAETPAATEPKTYPLVHSLFEHWAENQPDAVAIIDEFSNSSESELSFAELNIRANQLAHYLIEQGLISEPEQRIALCMSRSANMIVAMLGIMKAGGCYVPLDPEYPDARLQYVLQDSGAQVVLTENSLVSRFSAVSDCQLLLLDDAELQQHIQNQPSTNPTNSTLTSANLMYMIYTSGSTGKPKGVLVTHNNVSEFVQQGIADFLPAHIDGAVVSSSLVFDATVGSLWVALCAGRFIELLPEGAMALEQLGDYLADEDSNYLFKVTPSHLDAVAGSGYFASANSGTGNKSNAKHVVVVAGEALQMQSLQHWAEQLLPHSLIINEYGPTETTVGATIFPYSEQAKALLPQIGSAPIGHALGDTQLYVLNDAMQEQVNGGVGELYIGGTGVTRGYAGKAALTASRFVPNPFAKSTSTEGSRLYRTGDKVRWLFNNENQRTGLQFLGRIDEQIKLRGYRIETGEIEAMLLQQPGVNDAFVMLSQVENQSEANTENNIETHTETQLLAYVVVDQQLLSTQNSQIIKQLQQGLAQTLPAYMLPSHILLLDNLPLNVNGKVDKHQLPQPNADGVTRIGGQYVAPRNALEQQLCELWAELLNISLAENTNADKTSTENQPTAVGIEDNFFALGGHSLLATRLVSMIRERFNTELPLGILFESPTIAGLSSYMSQHLSEKPKLSAPAITPASYSLPSIQPAPEQAFYPVTTEQRKSWVNTQIRLSNQIPSHFVQRLIHFHNQDVHKALRIEKALNLVVAKHDMLRTTLHLQNDGGQKDSNQAQLFQKVHPHQPLSIRENITDISAERDKTTALERIRVAERERTVDVSQTYLFTAKLLRIHADYLILMFTVDHVCVDIISMDFIEADIKAIYDSLLWGRFVAEDKPAIDYKDYACWEHNEVHGENGQHHRDYWHPLITNNFDALNPLRYLIALQKKIGTSKTHHSDSQQTAPQSYRDAFEQQVAALDLKGVIAPEVFAQQAFGATRSIYATPLKTAGYRFCVAPAVFNGLTTLAKQNNSMLSSVLISAASVWLHQLTGQQQAFISVFSDTRMVESLYKVVGCFAQDTLFLTQVEKHMTLAQVCQGVDKRLQATYPHKVYPMMKIASELDISLAAMQTVRLDIIKHEQTLTPFAPEHSEGGLAEIGINLRIMQYQNGLVIDCKYRCEQFAASTIEALMQYWQTLLSNWVNNPVQPVQQLPLFNTNEQHNEQHNERQTEQP